MTALPSPSAAPPHTVVAIVNWNNAADTLMCLASVRAIRDDAFSILIVDNGSTDDSVATLRRAAPDVELLCVETNRGFGNGVNRALTEILRAAPRYVLLLNNDLIVDPDILAAFRRAAAEHPDAGFMTAKAYYYSAPDTIWHGFANWNPDTCRFEHVGHGHVDRDGAFEGVHAADFVNGCALFFSTELIREVGMIDTRIHCLMDDVDWCFGARALGRVNYYVGGARLWHKVAATFGDMSVPDKPTVYPLKEYYRTRNTLLIARKRLPRRQRRRVWRNMLRDTFGGRSWRAPTCARTLKRAYWNLVSWRRDPVFRARLRGLCDYVRGRFGEAPASVRALPAKPAGE